MPKHLDRLTEKKVRSLLADVLGNWALARIAENWPEEKEMQLLAHKVWHHIEGKAPCHVCRVAHLTKRVKKLSGGPVARHSK